MTKILFVDDEQNVLDALRRTLHGKYECEFALGPEAALRRLAGAQRVAVVVSDMRMPGMNGIELLKKVRELSADTVRVMLTGDNDLGTAIEAVNEGSIFRFVSKPCSPEVLKATLDASIRQHQLIDAERQLLEDTLGGCIRVLSEILSMTDARLFARCTSLQKISRQVTRALGLEQPWEIESAAMLAPIGCVAIPPAVMVRARASDQLTKPERDMLTRIPSIGHALLTNVPRMQGVAQIIKYQSKSFDGSGHPVDTVKGKAIPLGARLLRILNDLATERDKRQTNEEAFAQLGKRAGVYDPDLLRKVRSVVTAPALAEPNEAEVRAMTRRELYGGLVLAGDIVTAENTILVASGQIITATILERLSNFASTVGIREPILVRIATVASAS